MKTKSLIVALALTSFAATAQVAPSQPPTPATQSGSDNSSSEFKPAAGKLTFEMNLTPFSGTPISLSYLRARLFMSETSALRMGFSVGMQSQDPNNSFDWALLPGIEMHFTGTNRLSPYLGAELALAGRSSSSEYTEDDITYRTEGSWSEDDDYSHRGYFNLGLNAVAGTDFYVAKHLYIGLEAGFGIALMKNSDVVVSVTDEDGNTESVTEKGGSSFRLGPNFNSAIRVGFVF